MNEEKTKSYEISKRSVYESYLRVIENDGSAGVDKETIELFNKNLGNNLYKIWNRMSSGSYFPPAVKRVMIEKKQGGKRPLGIPTVGDRIAQGVVKNYLEGILEPQFHESSFGYRPKRSAHNAIDRCKSNCLNFAWVIDLDIKGFFDNVSHEWMMRMVEHHTKEKWVLLYIERWLKADVEQENGELAKRERGTPQGGVVSPLICNLYLHHSFDKWMAKYHRSNPFERYADDIIVHCGTEQEAKALLEAIRERLRVFELELHPEKTKIVYCKDKNRQQNYGHVSFTFLSYSFQPRGILGKNKKLQTVFYPAISCQAKAFIRKRIREVFNPRWTQIPLEDFALRLNPKLRGWVNYYSRYKKQDVLRIFKYLNRLIRKWISKKYRLFRKAAIKHFEELTAHNKQLFIHWKLDVL